MAIFKSRQKMFERHRIELKDPDPELRMRAAYELSNLGMKEAIPLLIGALSDNDKRVRWKAAYALGDFGEMGSEDAFQSLATHLSGEQDWNVRRIIVMALRHWDEKAVPYLVNALSDGSEYVRRYAAMTLGFKKAFEAGPHLKRLASIDSSKEVRSYARWALEQMKG